MTAPLLLDVVIAVHATTRPIGRAVSSLLGDGADGVRVTVVCHGIDVREIAAAVGSTEGPALRFVEYRDGIPSPAGPFNHGIRLADAEYVAIMGSDDFAEPGAVRAWRDYVRTQRPDVALMRLRRQNGPVLASPLTRVGRARALDAVRDRLFYRTAPLALIRRELLTDPALLLTEGLRTGDDMAMSSRLWADGARVDVMHEAPCYVIGADAADRVTESTMTVGEQLRAVELLVTDDWWRGLPDRVRTSLAIKMLRVHVLDALLGRTTTDAWTPEDRGDLARIVDAIVRDAPRALVPLSRADRALIEVARGDASATEVVAAIARRRTAGRLETILPRQWWRAFDRESTLVRFLLYRVRRGGTERG
ncbi:glycosyltransferase family 2 protein [Microbacterium sp. NPDC087592]|uniref:glycosyltransferase family 2 protein n=1 Tax=Microbacterium sp. NPDC087592 TaxID=3364193 RepID=UPI00380661D5